jgi:hypothetical protein
MPLNVVNVRGSVPPTRGPVLLVHGAGVRGNIFRAPVETTIVDALIGAGWDVWLENWRASIDLPANEWTLDQAALHDHPAAVSAVAEETGADSVKAIIHCQGSTSFMMSACAGLLPQVDVIVSNAVSLHPVVPRWSELKARYAVPVVHRLLSYLNPSWGDRPPNLTARAIMALVRAVHHECSSTVCKMVSFTYGSGFPALWRHQNLNHATHDAWLEHEFGDVPMTFFEQMARCIEEGHLVAYEDLPGLPADYVREPPATDARVAFLTGARNRCFLPASQVRSHEHFMRHGRGHTLHVLPRYSHLDVFMGKDAARDVFPIILGELERAA